MLTKSAVHQSVFQDGALKALILLTHTSRATAVKPQDYFDGFVYHNTIYFSSKLCLFHDKISTTGLILEIEYNKIGLFAFKCREQFG